MIKSDSQTALDVLVRGNGSKTKHYAVKVAFIIDTVARETIKMEYMASADNPADIFTKGLGKMKTTKHLDQLSDQRGCQSDLKAESFNVGKGAAN